MKTEDHIKRYLSDPDGLDFDGLRRRGIALLQDLSSQQWTDYNLHDPGVTLLELLSYGLTDLVYRTGFDVADFLAGPDGHIDFHHQALFPPQEIFPSEPVTAIDYCKLIYDHSEDVDDVWIRQREPGLTDIFIKPHESLFSRENKGKCVALQRNVEQLLHQHRNLCQGVPRIHMVQGKPYTLAGDIEIDDSRPAAEIYADIYFQCGKEISSGGQIVRFEEKLAQGMRWEDMLEGPLTKHGYIGNNHFEQSNYDVYVIDLIKKVRHIPGVRWVKSLCLNDEDGVGHTEVTQSSQPTADEKAVCPVLAFPSDPAGVMSLRLKQGKNTGQRAVGMQDDNPHKPGRHVVQFHEEIALHLRKLEFEHHAFRTNDGQLSRLLKLPQGHYRNLQEYSSIGEHTPAIYGINHYGVPKSDPPEVHARARQLKAYLYPFEQLMANYLASLQSVKRLYSTDSSLEQTYFAQFLTDTEVPNLNILYRDEVDAAAVDQVLAQQDNFADRRNRVLDSMLAVYGEIFPSDALKRYNVYHPDDYDQHLIACKIGLLSNLCDLSAGRGRAMNVERPYWSGQNLAPLQRRVQLLTGSCDTQAGRSLVAAVHSEQMRLISNKRYQDLLEREVDFGDTVALSWAQSSPEGRQVLEGLPHGAISPALLLAGVRKENYTVLPDGDHGWLCLNVEGDRCWPLLHLPQADMPAAACELRDSLINISKATEGFHLLEHVLLRPRAEGATHDVAADFYANRISVILPSFTARFSDPGCRAWVEEVISQNLPAHILPTFYWLDFVYLAQFEVRYGHWLEQLGEGGDAAAGDAAADKLIEFLNKVAPFHTNRHWM